jgi:hypothetical protein
MRKFVSIEEDYMEINLDEYIRDLEEFQGGLKQTAEENIERYSHLEDPAIDHFWPEKGYLFSKGMKLSEYINTLKNDIKSNGNKIIKTGYKFYIKKENVNGEWKRDGGLELSVVELARF